MQIKFSYQMLDIFKILNSDNINNMNRLLLANIKKRNYKSLKGKKFPWILGWLFLKDNIASEKKIIIHFFQNIYK